MPGILLIGRLSSPIPSPLLFLSPPHSLPQEKECFYIQKVIIEFITGVGKDWNGALCSFLIIWVDFGNAKWFKSTATKNLAIENPEGRGTP